MTTSSLRAVTHRLTTTPVQELPPIASFLATSLSDCAELLSAPQGQKNAKSDSQEAAQIHKLKTRLTSLLQDRSVEGRWTAVVLVKATVEAGQWEILRGCEPLVRNMITILGKPDPVSTKKMCIITLTRIFHLTYQYQTLVREITTPSLPAFITSALNLVSVKPSSEPVRKLRPSTPLLETVLHALVHLIARHPTIFRPFSAQIHSLLLEILSSSPPAYFSEPVVQLAERLFVSLHNCAPKNTGPDQWKDAIRMTIASAHRTTDQVYRAVVEQWESVDVGLRQAAKPQDYDQEMGDSGPNPLDFRGWRGVHSGADRLIVHLQLLLEFLSTPTASTVAIPLGYIIDLTSRLTSVTVPPEGADASQAGVQLNPQIGREERDALWAELPRIHTACINLYIRAIDILETGIVPVAQTILEQALWVFRAENSSKEIRTSLYNLTQRLITLIGPSMTKHNISSLTSILRTCCSDLLPQSGDQQQTLSTTDATKKKPKTSQTSVNADSFLNGNIKENRPDSSVSSSSALASSSPALHRAASALLPAILNYVPTEHLPPSVRSDIDRTAILTAHKDGMLASVLNPLPIIKGRGAAPSIIPFLARSYPDEMDVESLIRPRMPVLMDTEGYMDDIKEEEEDEVDEDDAVAYDIPAARVEIGTETGTGRAAQGFASSPSQNKRSHAEVDGKDASTSATASTHTPAPTPETTQNTTTQAQTKKARLDNTSAPEGPDYQPSLLQKAPNEPILPQQTPSTTAPPNPRPSQTPAVEIQTSAPDVVDSKAAEPSRPAVVLPREQSSASRAKAGAEVEGEAEGSDEELPTLNLEPDTEDEEGDDGDVAMDG